MTEEEREQYIEEWDEEDEEWDEEEDEEALEREARRGRALMGERFGRYDEAAELLLGELEQAGRTDLREELEALRLRLRQGPVRLLIVGVSCSGKSTLVNALAESFVAPEGATATSCIPLWVAGGDPAEGTGKTRFKDLSMHDGVLEAEPCNPVVALSQLCHAPGKGAAVPAGLEAVTAETAGGFLWDSGLTLVDTPGLGQQRADDAWTEKAVGMGAELLLIAHGANEKIPAETFQELFPGGRWDLGLDMHRDLFLLGNDIHSTKQGVCQTMQKLVAKWNSKAEKRFYWMNVLEQRLRIGYYKYSEWFPLGAKDEEDNRQKERLDRERWRMLEAARAAARASGGGEREEIVQFARLETQKNLEVAPDEAAREVVRQAEANRIKRALEGRENMEKLRRDLAARARELYIRPERICAPIEAVLERTARAVLEICLSRVSQAEERLRREVEQLSPRQLYDARPDCAGARDALEDLTKRQDSARERCRELARELEEIDSAGSFSGKIIGELREKGTGYGPASLNEKLEALSISDQKVLEGDWETEILQPVKDIYIKAREGARTAILDGTLFERLAGKERAILRGERQQELLAELDSALEYYASGDRKRSAGTLPERGDFTGEEAASRVWAELPEIGQCAGELEEKLREELVLLADRLAKEQEKKASRKPSLFGMVIDIVRTLISTHAGGLVRGGLKRLEEDILKDAEAWLRVCVQPLLEGELPVLEGGLQALQEAQEALDAAAQAQSEALQRRLEEARESLLAQRLEEEAAAERQRIQAIRQVMQAVCPETGDGGSGNMDAERTGV